MPGKHMPEGRGEINMEMQVGQVWRKHGPHGWLKIEKILDPRYPEYDGGLPGCVARYFPPQLKGIKLRGGKTYFLAGNWEEQIKMNRFLLGEGQPVNML